MLVIPADEMFCEWGGGGGEVRRETYLTPPRGMLVIPADEIFCECVCVGGGGGG